MCLSVVDAETTKKTQGFGYKVIEAHIYFLNKKKPIYSFLFKRLNGNANISFHKWLTAEDNTFNRGILSENRVLYPAGFHVYKNKKEALRDIRSFRFTRRLVRVQYRKVKASGLQDGKTVIIADQIKFLNLTRLSKKEIAECQN